MNFYKNTLLNYSVVFCNLACMQRIADVNCQKQGCNECTIFLEKIFESSPYRDTILENQQYISHNVALELKNNTNLIVNFLKQNEEGEEIEGFGSTVSPSLQFWSVAPVIEKLFYNPEARIVELGGWTNALILGMLFPKTRVFVNDIDADTLIKMNHWIGEFLEKGLLFKENIEVFMESALKFYDKRESEKKDIVLCHNLLHFFSNKEEEVFFDQVLEHSQLLVLSFNSLQEYKEVNELSENEFFIRNLSLAISLNDLKNQIANNIPAIPSKRFSYMLQLENSLDFLPIEEEKKKFSKYKPINEGDLALLLSEKFDYTEKFINPNRLKEKITKTANNNYICTLAEEDKFIKHTEDGVMLLSPTTKITYNMIFEKKGEKD